MSRPPDVAARPLLDHSRRPPRDVAIAGLPPGPLPACRTRFPWSDSLASLLLLEPLAVPPLSRSPKTVPASADSLQSVQSGPSAVRPHQVTPKRLSGGPQLRTLLGFVTSKNRLTVSLARGASLVSESGSPVARMSSRLNADTVPTLVPRANLHFCRCGADPNCS
jgi:hypothetical protein